MNEAPTSTLLKSAIDTRLKEHLAHIDEKEKAEATVLETAARADPERQLSKMHNDHERAMQFENERALRKAADAQQGRVWSFERESVTTIEQGIREKLAASTPDQAGFVSWLDAARAELESDRLLLEMNEAWLQALGKQTMEVRTLPLLGGAILTDLESGRQVDGSWDRRLAELMPEIRERWEKDVSPDH